MDNQFERDKDLEFEKLEAQHANAIELEKLKEGNQLGSDYTKAINHFKREQQR